LEGNYRGLIEVPLRNFSGGTEEIQNISVRTADVPAEIRPRAPPEYKYKALPLLQLSPLFASEMVENT
jgi:hypothetical protein